MIRDLDEDLLRGYLVLTLRFCIGMTISSVDESDEDMAMADISC